jgi:hypothetical protein
MSYTGRYDKGDWKAICDVCGRLYKSSMLSKRWDGLMCCSDDWEIRQPQDFVRGVADTQIAPWLRDEGTNNFVTIPYTKEPVEELNFSESSYRNFTKNINTYPGIGSAINSNALNTFALNTNTFTFVPTNDEDIKFQEIVTVFTGYAQFITDTLTIGESIYVFKPSAEALNGSALNSGAINQ